jgi:hypothetical protein
MNVVILQSNYIPWKGYFDLIHDADIFVFYDCVKYTKNDWRNRNVIYTKNGKQWLTIPIASAATSEPIDKALLPSSNWRTQHLRSLEMGYGRAPHFQQAKALMEEFLHGDFQSLSALNQAIIKRVSTQLGCKTTFLDSRELPLLEDRVERLLHILKSLNATRYISGRSAQCYLNDHKQQFANLGIELVYKDYGPYQPYRQLSTPFEENVSIIDLIANVSWDQIPNHIWNSYEQ